MRGPKKVCQKRSISDSIILVDERKEDQNTTKSRPSSISQRNTIEMAFCWRADGDLILNISRVLLKNPIFF